MKLKMLLTIGVVLAAFTAYAQTTVELFNGKNLDGWHIVLDPKSNAKPESVFGVKNGVIATTGEPFGFIYTDGVYSDFRLHVEWRYVKKFTNSGVFVFVQEPKFWPNSIECQLKADRAGDFVKMGGSTIEPGPGSDSLARRYPSNENPLGEWNNMVIICRGNTVTVFVNGAFQNHGVNAENSKGHIALQSEGGPLEFRNVRLTPLEAMMK